MLSIQEMARRLGVSAQTVWRLVRSGELPAVRAGVRQWRVKESDFNAYMERQRNQQD